MIYIIYKLETYEIITTSKFYPEYMSNDLVCVQGTMANIVTRDGRQYYQA